MEDTNLQMGMLDTTPIRKGISTTAVISGSDASDNLTVYFGKEHYRNDFISTQQGGPHYVYFQGFTNTTLASSEEFNLNGNSFRLTSDYFGYSGEGNQAISNIYLRSTDLSGGSSDDSGKLSVDLSGSNDVSGTPTSTNIYHVQVYDDGADKKFRWKLSTDSGYTTGNDNTITANTPLYLKTGDTAQEGFYIQFSTTTLTANSTYMFKVFHQEPPTVDYL